MVGYSISQKGYRIFNPQKKTTQVVRDVRFFEEKFLEVPTSTEDNNKFEWPEDWSGEVADPEEPEDTQEVEAEQDSDINEYNDRCSCADSSRFGLSLYLCWK